MARNMTTRKDIQNWIEDVIIGVPTDRPITMFSLRNGKGMLIMEYELSRFGPEKLAEKIESDALIEAGATMGRSVFGVFALRPDAEPFRKMFVLDQPFSTTSLDGTEDASELGVTRQTMRHLEFRERMLVESQHRLNGKNEELLDQMKALLGMQFDLNKALFQQVGGLMSMGGDLSQREMKLVRDQAELLATIQNDDFMRSAKEKGLQLAETVGVPLIMKALMPGEEKKGLDKKAFEEEAKRRGFILQPVETEEEKLRKLAEKHGFVLQKAPATAPTPEANPGKPTEKVVESPGNNEKVTDSSLSHHEKVTDSTLSHHATPAKKARKSKK